MLACVCGWLGVGVEYFGDAVHFQNESVWVGTPPSAQKQRDLKRAIQAAPGENVDATGEWMLPVLEVLRDVLSELVVEDEYEIAQSQRLEDGDRFTLVLSVAVAIGAALFALAPNVYHFV
eukprot:SAG31_NODE_4597_length_3105_cov_2.095143_3_plen_120_part_00